MNASFVDECAPSELKSFLSANGFDCSTVQEAGWAGKENGELLALANGQYDAFVTLDRKLRYQQNVAGLKLGIVVMRGRSNRIEDLRSSFSLCVEALRSIRSAAVIEIGPLP